MYWSRLASPIREFGLGAGSLYLLDRALRRISGGHIGLKVYELIAQPVPDGPLLPARHANDLRYRELSRSDAELSKMPPTLEVLHARFDQGAVCLAVYRKGAFIGYIWLCFTNYVEDEVRCNYVLANVDTSSFDFDVYIFPEHRLGRAFAALWHAANDYLRARGVRYTFSRIERLNMASRRAHARLGGVCIGHAAFLRIAGLQCMLASVSPYLALSFGTRRPTLRLHYDRLDAQFRQRAGASH